MKPPWTGGFFVRRTQSGWCFSKVSSAEEIPTIEEQQQEQNNKE
jgi:hypothetical protein